MFKVKRFAGVLTFLLVLFMTAMIIVANIYAVSNNKASAPEIFIDSGDLEGNADIESELSEIFYFSASSCSDCSVVQGFLDSLEKAYTININGKEEWSNISVTKFEIEDEDSLRLIKKLFDDYNVPDDDRKVPIIFLKDGYLSGKDEIKEQLVNAITKGQAVFQENERESLLELDGRMNSLTGYEVPGLILTGLLNGLNPCSISMLLFFISMLLLKNSNILKLGLAFIFGKFLAYLMLGTVLFNLLLRINGSWFNSIQGVARIILIIICLLLAYLNIVDFISSKNERYNKIRLQLPASLRELNHKWIKSIQSVKGTGILTLTSFGLGVVVSAGEFLCTGQIYLATIVLMIRNNPVFDIKTVLYFILYGVALVIPLLVLSIIMHKGNEMFQVSEKIRKNMPIIKLANALIFLLFGILIFIKF